jgi:hypothetical protein
MADPTTTIDELPEVFSLAANANFPVSVPGIGPGRVRGPALRRFFGLDQLPPRSYSGNHTLELADEGSAVVMTSTSAAALTVPTDAAVPFPLGTTIPVWFIGAGPFTITAAGGVSLLLDEELAAAPLRVNSWVWLWKYTPTAWSLDGSLAEA